MKRLFISLLLSLATLPIFSVGPTTIIDFPSVDSLDCLSGTLYAQNFTMPAGNDYYISKMGIKVCETSPAGKFYFALYNGLGELLYKSKEVVYAGGTESTLLVDIPMGLQDVKAGGNYYMACIGTSSFILKRQLAAVNSGNATLDAASWFKTGVVYPYVSDPIALTNSYGFNLSFVLEGYYKSTAIEPKDEILDFNCVSMIELNTGNVYFDEITMPAGENKALRQIGIKTDTCTATGTLKFAVYDNTNSLLYVTNELAYNLTGVADTLYVGLPVGAVILNASQSYKIAISYNSTDYLPVLKMRTPVSRGLASINSYSWFDVGNTYPTFPSTITVDGAYGFALGFVLNGDEPDIPTQINTITNTSALRIFPTVANNTVGLYAEGLEEEATVTVYSMLGEKICQTNWNTASSLALQVAGYSQGNYLVQISSPSIGVKTLKFLKK